MSYQDTTGALCANSHPGSYTGQDAYSDMFVTEDDVMENNEPMYAVRRLTPNECERLQGFPDFWTSVGDYYVTDKNGKKKRRHTTDSNRYKALGNSIALPFWRFLARNISDQYDRPVTIGSLFDGIGGFPKVFEEVNGPYTARWASEIEEFPIAVTKLRFPEPELPDWLD